MIHARTRIPFWQRPGTIRYGPRPDHPGVYYVGPDHLRRNNTVHMNLRYPGRCIVGYDDWECELVITATAPAPGASDEDRLYDLLGTPCGRAIARMLEYVRL